jgi:stress-induced-phosphoprotein 1
MVGQDRAEHYGFGGRGGSTGGGGTKGGDAGSRTKPGVDLSFVRHVPKFLQAHAHMLNKSVEEDEPEAALLKQKYDDDATRGREEEEGDDDDERQASACQASLSV